jgi:hypothetical protein
MHKTPAADASPSCGRLEISSICRVRSLMWSGLKLIAPGSAQNRLSPGTIAPSQPCGRSAARRLAKSELGAEDVDAAASDGGALSQPRLDSCGT